MQRSVRKIMAQFGGGNPAFNPTAPGGLGFGRGPGSMGAGQINRYYETPLDANFKRVFDASYTDDKVNIEKRLEIFHGDIENDLKNCVLKDGQINELDKSDKKLRYEKLMTPDKKAEVVQEKVLEVCLDAARTNDDSKHPFEDELPPTIKPSRRHTFSIRTDRMLGTSPFLGYEEDEDDEDRSPFDVAKFTTPMDGSKRYYPFKEGKEVSEFLDKPFDVDFGGLYGESLAFDHPQDKEQPSQTTDIAPHEIAKIINQQQKNKVNNKKKNHGGESGLEEKRRQDLMRLPDGPGKTMRMDLFLGDTRDEFQEVMGVADKFSNSPAGSAGLGNIGFSSA